MNFHIHQGDALTVLRSMPDASVHCCITSPPYWGLRDYGTAAWVGGLPACDHIQRHGLQGETGQRADRTHKGSIPYKAECGKCGATRVDLQIGLECTPAEYVEKMVEVFREVRRVLRDDGTLWLNLGDSYTSGGRDGHGTRVGYKQSTNRGANDETSCERAPNPPGLKPKDLCGIPWRVALALQADGWYWRDCIVWHKPAPMPESVRDRCTKAWEPIFMFAKSERYYFDQDSLREPHSREWAAESVGPQYMTPSQGRNDGGKRQCDFQNPAGRNKRNVWTLSPMATPDAHFATFPLELPETCLKAGCPEDGTVLDSFAGAGTTGLACLKQSRNFVGIELNSAYIDIAYSRARKYYPLLMEATA